MSPTSSFMTRRRGLADAVDLNRDRSSLMRRSRSIGGVRNVTRDETGKRVAMPTSAQISGGTAPSSFYRSMAPTRADRVRAAMIDGSFSGIRSKFNESNAGKQVMDADGTIRAHNPYRDGGQLGGSQTVTTTAPAAPTQPTPPATVATKPQQQPAGPREQGSRPGESLARAGVIRDETGDITNRIRSSMAGTSTTTKPVAPANPAADQALKQATALRDATAGTDSATKLVAATQSLLNKSRAAVAVHPAAKAATAQVPTKPAVPSPITASSSAVPTGPRLSFGAPKWQPATPVDGSGIADTMKNNQMIRPGFDKIIAAQKFPVPTAAMPKPASSSPTSLAGIEARAAGGPVQAGKPYLVGEKGPELIVPQKSGTVVPNHDLPKTYVRDHAKGPGAMKPKEPRAAPTVPKTAKEATKMGLQDAVLGLQAMGQSAVNAIVPDSVLQGKQQRAAEDQAYRNDVNQARDAFDGGGGVGGFLTEAAVRLPGNIINTAAEVYSPSNKIAAATAGYHGVRKYAETGDATQAGIAAASNLIGEKLEDKAGPVLKRLIPKWPSNLAGNAGGTVLEKAVGSAVDAWRYGAAPAPISPPPPKPRPTLTAPVIAAAPRIAPYGPMPKMLSSSPARPAKTLQPPRAAVAAPQAVKSPTATTAQVPTKPAAAQPLPPAAPPPVQPRIAPFGTMPKMIASSAPTSRPAEIWKSRAPKRY